MNAITSSHLENNSDGSGFYYLPKKLITVELNRSDRFKVCTYEIDGVNKQSKEQIEPKFEAQFVKETTVPDYDYGYSIDYDKSLFSKDKLTIDISKDGLLDKIYFKAEESTDKIIIKTVEVAGKAIVLPYIPAERVPITIGANCTVNEDDKPSRVAQITFDPLEPDGLKVVQDSINMMTENNIDISIQKSYEDYVPENNVHKAEKSSCSEGICYRPLKHYDLVFTKSGTEYYRNHLLLPAKDTILSIDVSRAIFVEKITKIDFEDGLLTQVDIDKPSEALAVVTLPLEILNSIIKIPTELIQFKINTINKDKELLEAQKQHIETQKALIELQEELMKKLENIDNKDSDDVGATEL